MFENSKSGGVEEAQRSWNPQESLIQEIGENIMIRRIKTINSKIVVLAATSMEIKDEVVVELTGQILSLREI